jgi:hypothetical protein
MLFVSVKMAIESVVRHSAFIGFVPGTTQKLSFNSTKPSFFFVFFFFGLVARVCSCFDADAEAPDGAAWTPSATGSGSGSGSSSGAEAAAELIVGEV